MDDKKKYFKKNLKILQKMNAFLAYHVEAVDPSGIEFCLTQQDELNLQRIHEGKTYHYHSLQSAKKEAEEWFQSLDLHTATTIFVYGIGLGYYYAAAQEWLKQHPHHALIFLEEDLNVIHRLCETELGWHLLKNPQVQLVYFRSRVEDKTIFNELSWTYFDSPFVISSLKLYKTFNPEACLQMAHEISYDLVQKKALVDEYLQYGIAFFRNYYHNMLELPRAYSGNALFNCFENVPAIICGAGPSLNKNIDLLAGLQKQALLFAGSSSLNALIPKGIIPHFGVAIDPNKAQYSRVEVAQHHQIPFFYRNRLYYEALTAIKGPRLYLTGAGGYEISRWFEEQLNIEGDDLDEGNNVVNFSIEIAQALGCNPIILVGVDLAFTDQHHYADGVMEDLHLTEEDLKTDDDFESRPLLREDLNGKPVYTLWKWLTESEWIADFAEKHPEITLINATEGGIGFKDVPNQSLHLVVGNYLKESQEKINTINSEIEKHALAHVTEQRLKTLFIEMQTSLDHCIVYLSRLMEEVERMTEDIKDGKTVPDELQTVEGMMLEKELEKEIGYHALLDTFNEIYIRLKHRDIQDLRSTKRRISKKVRSLKKLEIQRERLVFLRDTARINRELIQRALGQRL